MSSGFYYLNSRYYDPVVGRFINADAAWVLGVDQGNLLQYNLFTYVLNNPVMYVDSDGYFAIIATLATIGASKLALWLAGGCAVIIVCTIAIGEIDRHLHYAARRGRGGNNSENPSAPRSPHPPAGRYRHRTRKAAEQAAERAARQAGYRGAVHHPQGSHGRHFHPNVPPKHPLRHEHHFYSIIGAPVLFNSSRPTTARAAAQHRWSSGPTTANANRLCQNPSCISC